MRRLFKIEKIGRTGLSKSVYSTTDSELSRLEYRVLAEELLNFQSSFHRRKRIVPVGRIKETNVLGIIPEFVGWAEVHDILVDDKRNYLGGNSDEGKRRVEYGLFHQQLIEGVYAVQYLDLSTCLCQPLSCLNVPLYGIDFFVDVSSIPIDELKTIELFNEERLKAFGIPNDKEQIEKFLSLYCFDLLLEARHYGQDFLYEREKKEKRLKKTKALPCLLL